MGRDVGLSCPFLYVPGSGKKEEVVGPAGGKKTKLLFLFAVQGMGMLGSHDEDALILGGFFEGWKLVDSPLQVVRQQSTKQLTFGSWV